MTASAFDRDEPSGRVACEALTWTTPDGPRTGCSTDLVFNTLGDNTIIVVARDSRGAEGPPAMVTIHVVPAPANPPPVVSLSVTRRDGSLVADDENVDEPEQTPLQLHAEASDADPLTFFWFARDADIQR